MRRSRGIGFGLARLFGVIALAAILAAILFPSFGQAREARGRAGSSSSSRERAAVIYTPFAAYDAVQSALTDYDGSALALDSRDRARIPALEPGAVHADRENFRVYSDGHIQNLALGSSGFLTRDTSGPAAATVRFTALGPDDPNQVWNFEAGPELPDGGTPGMQRYTLVVAPVSARDRSIFLLSAAEAGGQIVMEKRRYPIRSNELDQLPLGLRWDFRRHDDVQSQRGTLARSDSQPDEDGMLLLPSHIRSAAACALTPGLTAMGKRATLRGRACPNLSHVQASCIPTWHNPACPGDPASASGCTSGSPCICGHNY